MTGISLIDDVHEQTTGELRLSQICCLCDDLLEKAEIGVLFLFFWVVPPKHISSIRSIIHAHSWAAPFPHPRLLHQFLPGKVLPPGPLPGAVAVKGHS